jgi:PAS domain S-box-containing protein
VVKRLSGYSRSIRRRVIGLFLFLVFVIFFPTVLILYSWLNFSYRKLDEKRLARSYASFVFFATSQRHFLEALAKVYGRDKAVLSCLSGQGDAVAADVVSLKQRADLNVMSVLDASGRLLRGDSGAAIFETRSAARQQWLASLNGQSVSGFALDNDGGLWLLSVGPLAGYVGEDRGTGFLMLGFNIDSVFLEKLGKEIDAGIQIIPKEDIENRPVRSSFDVGDYRIFWQELLYGQRPYVVFRARDVENEQACLGALLRDIQGEAKALLLLKASAGYFLWSPRMLIGLAWLVIILFGFSIYFISRVLGQHVTMPLVRLRGAIREIASSGNLSRRLQIDEEDEVGDLITEFNAMMQALEEANDKLKRSSDELSSLYADLLDQKKFTSEIFAMAQSIVLVLLPDGRVKYVNEAIERIAGFKTEEVIGRNWFDNFLPFKIRSEVWHVFEDILKGSATVARQHQNEMLAKDGSERMVLWSHSFLKDKDGKVVSVLSIGQDVSEFRKVEVELRQRMRDLERFHKVTMDREKIVMELKKEIAALRAQIDSSPKASS